MMKYENEYGTLNLIPVTSALPIGDITYQHPAVQANLMTLEEAEQVALITENVGIQIGVHLSSGPPAAYVVLHYFRGSAAVCRCDIVSWHQSLPANDILEDLHKNPYAGLIPVACF